MESTPILEEAYSAPVKKVLATLAKLEESYDTLDKFTGRIENLDTGESDAAIASLLQICDEIKAAGSESNIFMETMEHIQDCSDAVDDFEGSKRLREKTSTCTELAWWITDKLGRQVFDCADCLIRWIKELRETGDETARQGTVIAGSVDHHLALSLLTILRESWRDPEDPDGFRKLKYYTNTSDEEASLAHMFELTQKIADQFRQIRSYLQGMTMHVGTRYLPDVDWWRHVGGQT